MTAGRSTTPRRGPTGTSGAEETSPQRLWAWLGGVLRRLNEQLTSLNARMEGESSCRRCGVCHHVCGMLTTSRRGGVLPKE